MPSDTLILGFDTSAAHCAAALLYGNEILDVHTEEMGRGQAERLMRLLQELMAAQNVEFADLSALAVGIGPGNFTGIRIAVSAARGLALALNIPAIGISTFDAIRHDAGIQAVCLPAPRDRVYFSQDCNDHPRLIAKADIPAPEYLTMPEPSVLTETITRVAYSRLHSAHPPPAPLYIKPADAAPAKDQPPVILS